jgi:small subunit ribosomal protein S25e
MGGGKKKQSIKQMTKPKAPKKTKQRSKKNEPETAKRTLGLTIPDVNNKKVIAELKGLKVLTPSIVASRYNIRLSLANAFLKDLEKRKIIEYVSGGKNLKIYKRIEKVTQ